MIRYVMEKFDDMGLGKTIQTIGAAAGFDVEKEISSEKRDFMGPSEPA